MKKVYLLCGLQGSGKSTYAKTHAEALNSKIVSTDQIRIKYAPIEEEKVFPTAYQLISEHIKEGYNVIFDATNINSEMRKKNLEGIQNLVEEKIEFICICLKTDKEICKLRVEKRNTLKGEIFLPLEVIDSFDHLFEEPVLEEGFNEIIFVK